MRLLLIRHGESVANAEGRLQGQVDSPLSEAGRQQARALAERLAGDEPTISAIYASDLSRAAETAQIVAGRYGLPLTLDTRLREYDWGRLSGSIWREVEFLYPEIWQQWHSSQGWVSLPEDEGHEPFVRRLAAAMASIRAAHQDEETVAVVSHGRSLGMILCHLLDIETRRRLPFHFGNASLTIVELRPRGASLALHNDTCHLNGHRT
jgi:broad specificity phosphatase PhoE